MCVFCVQPSGLLDNRPSHSPATAPLVLFALLLLRAPDGFTLRTLLQLEGLGERPGPQNHRSFTVDGSPNSAAVRLPNCGS